MLVFVGSLTSLLISLVRRKFSKMLSKKFSKTLSSVEREKGPHCDLKLKIVMQLGYKKFIVNVFYWKCFWSIIAGNYRSTKTFGG